MNTTTISGRLGKTPELKTGDSGNQFTNFSVAVKDRFGKEPVTTWYNVVAWAKLAEHVCKYFKVGDTIEITGRMQSRKFVKDNVERELWQLIAERVDFPQASKPREASDNNGNETPEVDGNKVDVPVSVSGDLPF